MTGQWIVAREHAKEEKPMLCRHASEAGIHFVDPSFRWVTMERQNSAAPSSRLRGRGKLCAAPATGYAPSMAAADFACPAIAIRDLVKVYAGGKRALDGITVDVPQGQIFGLLGPNGAGKSTLINILAGPVNKTRGSDVVGGLRIDE